MGLETSAVRAGGVNVQNEQQYQVQESAAGTGFQTAIQNAYQNQAESMDDIFEEAAVTYGISVDLLKAVAKAESNFNPSAVSHAGAMGVMQLMPGTAASLGVTDPYDARQNIMGGAKYLKTNLDRFGGDVSLALAAYNAGPNSVIKYGGIPPYQETQNYVKKVTSYMEGSPLYANAMVSSTGSSSSASSLSELAKYGSTALLGLSGLYGGSSSGSVGSLFGDSSSDSSSDLFGSSSFGSLYGTSALAGLGNGYGSSALTGTGSMYGLSSIYGSSANMLSLLFNSALQSGDEEDDDTITMKKDSFYNLVELMRLQMMMNISSGVGSITI